MNNDSSAPSGGQRQSNLVPLARLWRRTSARGNEYFTGFLQDAKIVILEDGDHDPDDPKSSTHRLFISPKQAR